MTFGMPSYLRWSIIIPGVAVGHLLGRAPCPRLAVAAELVNPDHHHHYHYYTKIKSFSLLRPGIQYFWLFNALAINITISKLTDIPKGQLVSYTRWNLSPNLVRGLPLVERPGQLRTVSCWKLAMFWCSFCFDEWLWITYDVIILPIVVIWQHVAVVPAF